MKLISLITLFTIISALQISADTIHVNALTGNDTDGNGSPDNPYKTITKALDASVNEGDSILAFPGTYDVVSGEIFPIEMKSGRILLGALGADSTIIDASGSNERVINCIGNSNTTIIQGFTITGGVVTALSNGSNSQGGGISCTGGDKTIIQGNIITGNIAKGYDFNQVMNGRNGGNSYGGGIYISGSSTTIINNIISYNKAQGGGGENWLGGFSGDPADGGMATGGAMDATFANGAVIYNNTFIGNMAIGGPGGATNNGIDEQGRGGKAISGALALGFNSFAGNNIFYNNESLPGNIGEGDRQGESQDGAVTCYNAENISHNLYFNNSAVNDQDGFELGTDNIFADPMFLSSTDFHLADTLSPAYHSGTPTGAPLLDFEGVVRNDPPSIGAFEGIKFIPLDVRFISNQPGKFSLAQNYPNPFNPSTKIKYLIMEAGNVKIAVFNLLGENVAEIINQYQDAGTYEVDFNASGISSGVYFYLLESGSNKIAKKMTLLR